MENLQARDSHDDTVIQLPYTVNIGRMKRLIVLAFLLSACASAQDRDFLGHIYPPQCLGDLSYVKTPVVYVPRDRINAMAAVWNVKPEARLYGFTWAGKLIVIDESLRGPIREDTLRHERCHVIAGDWHR